MGFNMSWICVDRIDQNALYAALDLVRTGGTPDRYDLGTSHVPWAGATLKSGWCAVFARYSLALDLAVGTDPPRLARLPAKSRCVMSMVLEGPMISYGSLWQGGRCTWLIRNDSNQGAGHLEAFGDLPAEFLGFREIAGGNRRVPRMPFEWGVEDVFEVPLEMAAAMTKYRYSRGVEADFFGNLQSLRLADGTVLTDPGDTTRWWQWDSD